MNINEIISRYILLFFLSLTLLTNTFSQVLTFLLTKISYIFYSLFYEVRELSNGLLFIEINHIFFIVEACLGISAYILFSIIFFSIPLQIKESIVLIIKSSLLFTLINILRILLLIYLYLVINPEIFHHIHIILYSGLTGAIVAILIIYFYKKENIKFVPFVSDIKNLAKYRKSLKKTK